MSERRMFEMPGHPVDPDLDGLLMRITDQPMYCPYCGWGGKLESCEPDIDGDGNRSSYPHQLA